MPKVRTFFNIPQILEQPVLATKDKKKQTVMQNVKGGMNALHLYKLIHRIFFLSGLFSLNIVCFSFGISAWGNLKLSREIEDRRRLDQINFERAGTGPLVRTYKFDPTKK